MKNNFTPIIIAANRYCNEQPLEGFIESNSLYSTDTPYYPFIPSHAQIIESLNNFGLNLKGLICQQLIFSVPFNRINYDPQYYKLVNELESFETTLVTCWLIKKDYIFNANSYFTIKENSELQLLSEFASKHLTSNTLITNGGFFITPNLIYNSNKSKKWAFEKRYPEFQLSSNLSPYYGFYYLRKNLDIFSTFQDFSNRGCVVISDNNISLIPRLNISEYQVSFDNKEYFTVKEINNLSFNSPIVLITSACITSKNLDLAETIKTSAWNDNSWQNYAEIIVNKRVNIFITNRGTGTHPEDFIATIWEDKIPLINLGSILSFEKEYFAKIWGSINSFKEKYLGKRVYIIPKLNEELINAESIYSLSIPLIENGVNLLSGESAKTIMDSIDNMGLTHPNFQLSQESIPLSPYRRVPSHVLIETESYFGGILFNGRYEKSMGACLLDEVNIIKLMERKKLLPEPIINAVKADGGSAAKIALWHNNSLTFGNLPAAGLRNAFGDGDSNFYGGITFELS